MGFWRGFLVRFRGVFQEGNLADWRCLGAGDVGTVVSKGGLSPIPHSSLSRSNPSYVCVCVLETLNCIEIVFC